MRYVARCLAAGIIVLLAACRENTPVQPRQPTGIKALIVDGAHSGNPHFFFLPPLVPNPSAFFTAGQFNSHLAPTVEVCQLAANPVLGATDCTGAPPVFGPTKMALDLTNQQYVLNWNTQSSLLDVTAFYRITVRGAAPGTALGSLDVDPVLGGMKNLKTGDVVVFQDGRTLAIKVRIENGAFGATNPNDFVEQVVPNVIPSGTLDVTTNTGFAGARFSSGWLRTDLGIDQVVVIIERAGANCLDTVLEEMEGCYRFRTDPNLHLIEGALPFAQNVIAGVCFQVPADISLEGGPPFELTRQEEFNGLPTGGLTPLQEVPAPFIHCDGFGPTVQTIGAALRSGRLSDIARAAGRAVSHTIARVIQPATLHAVDLGAGGSTDGMSLFGYVRFASMTVTSGNGATAPAGSTVQAAVQLQNNHHGATTPVVGQSVTFTVPAGSGGSVSTGSCPEGNSCAATTGADGVATVTWRLGVGVNSLQVTTSHVTNSPATITATGTLGLLVIPDATNFAAGPGVTLPLTQTNGASMQSGTGVQLEVSPTTTVSWSSLDPLSTAGSVNTTGLVAIVQGNDDPAVAHELDVLGTGASAAGVIKINSYAFDHFPRWTTLVWRPVPLATSYDVEFQFANGCTTGTAVCTTWTPHFGSPATTSNTGFVFQFVGAQPGRWRVTAHLPGGVNSTSEWVYFAYII